MRSVLLLLTSIAVLSCTDGGVIHEPQPCFAVSGVRYQSVPICRTVVEIPLSGSVWEEGIEKYYFRGERVDVKYRRPLRFTGLSLSLDDPRILNDPRLPAKTDKTYDRELIAVGLSVAKRLHAVELKFPKRVYEIAERDARDHLFINGYENLVLNGQGSTLMFEGYRTGLRIHNAKHMALKNFVIDYKKPMAFPGTIEQSDEHGPIFRLRADIAIDPNEVPTFSSFLSFNTTARRWPVREPQLQLFSRMGADANQKWNYLGVVDGFHTWKFLIRSAGGGNRLENVTPGHQAIGIVRNHSGAVFIGRGTRWITAKNVTVYSSPGVGFLLREGMGGYRFENIVIDRRPGDANQMISTAADGFFNMSHRGNLSIVESTLRFMGDDGFNNHGIYHKVQEKLGPRKLRVNPHHVKNILPKDWFQFVTYNPGPFQMLGGARVETISHGEDSVDLTFDRDLPENVETARFLNRHASGARYVFRKNTVEYNRGRGAWVHSGRGAITANTFSHQTWGGIYLTADPYLYNAGPGVYEMLVMGNKINSQSYGIWENSLHYIDPVPGPYIGNGLNAAIRVGARVHGGDGLPANGPLTKINIENNSINGAAGLGMLISSVTDAVVRGNTIKQTNGIAFPGDADACGGLMIFRAKDVVEEENAFANSLGVCRR